jgi:hypothetical protein
MALRLSPTLRSARATSIVTAAGSAAKMVFYDGAIPSTGGTPAGVARATLVFGATLGTVDGNGVLTLGSVTQSNSSHSAGTPTFARIVTSANVFVADIDIGAGATNMTFTGTISQGVDVNLNASTITEGNA